MDVPKSVTRAAELLGWLLASAAIAALALAAILGIAWASHWVAGYFQMPFPDGRSASPFSGFGFHGYVLLAIATIGLPIAIWRGYALHKQSSTAQSELLNERYQKGVEMLGSEDLSVRLGGIYALENLAENEPDTYHIQIISVLSAFVRNWPTKGGLDSERSSSTSKHEKRGPPEDVCAILDMIGRRSSRQHAVESEKKRAVDLTGAYLHNWACHIPGHVAFLALDFSNVDFSDADLSEAFVLQANLADSNFRNADLSKAWLQRADFSRADFIDADLSDTLLGWANLAGASFKDAKLFGTNLTGAKGLTQEQLNSAEIDPQRPPMLADAVDPITGQPLVVPDQQPAA